jgi:hypothetical protein
MLKRFISVYGVSSRLMDYIRYSVATALGVLVSIAITLSAQWWREQSKARFLSMKIRKR